LDIDTVGPGRRADDLACLLAPLSVLADYGNAGRIDRTTQERVEEAIRTWHGTFSEPVDPTELALRSAGVVLSLATGPHRQQEAAWEAATEAIVRVAEEWVSAARRAQARAHAAQHAAARPTGPATTPGREGAPHGPGGPAASSPAGGGLRPAPPRLRRRLGAALAHRSPAPADPLAAAGPGARAAVLPAPGPRRRGPR